MKKTLLVGIATLFSGVSISLNAQLANPEIFNDETLTAISSNGIWAAGVDKSEAIVLRNLETGKVENFGATYSMILYGNPLSDEGVLLGKNNKNELGYWEKGSWTSLKGQSTPAEVPAAGITPDGNTICGNLGQMAATGIIPAVWVKQSNGSYSNPIELPYPALDADGEEPQRVEAISISADGKIIAGQYLNGSGNITQPIIFVCDDAGNWSYRLVAESMYDTEGQLPPQPEWPDYPDPLDYMSEESIAAYEQALKEYEETGEGSKPYPYMFMTEEDDEVYNEALAIYQEESEGFFDELAKWDALYQEFLSKIFILGNNYALISGNGKYFVSNRMVQGKSESIEGSSMMYPVVFNIEDDTYYEFPSEISMVANSVSDEGIILAFTTAESVSQTEKAYVFTMGSSDMIPLEEYIETVNVDVAAWMNDVMVNEVAISIEGTKYIYGDFMCSGAPVATPDLYTILTSINSTNEWQNASAKCLSYLLPIKKNEPSAVESVGIAENLLIVSPGNIELKGEFDFVEIYNVAGCKLKSFDTPSSTIPVGLTNGVYIIKAMTVNGEKIVKKVAF